MYLEPTDPRYSEHHVFVVDETSPKFSAGYHGMKDPINQEDYQKWIDTLPHVWRDNPFHNHFVFVDSDITDGQVKKLVSDCLSEFFSVWSRGKSILKYWQVKVDKPAFMPKVLTSKELEDCESKLAQIKVIMG